jgi:alcohol dehydrogenase class IV
MTIYFPGKLVFGNGVTDQLSDEVIQLKASKVVILTIVPLLEKISPLIDKLKANAVEVLIDVSIVQEPGFHDFEQLVLKVKPFSPEIVIGIGGGSVLDVAKLLAAQLDNDQSLQEYVGIGLLKGRKKHLICIPATSGTGSEMSPNAILVDDTDGQKKGVISPFLVPDIVYVDPLLTHSLPPSVTAATGIDALTHCMEAYTNRFSQPFIDMYAFEGMQLIAQNIIAAVHNGTDAEARSKLAMGSLLGGICLGPVNTAGVHALSYPLGSMYHLPHGLSNALLLPYIMEYNLEAVPGKYAAVAVALGCERLPDDQETARSGVEKIRQLIAGCGLPSTLREVGVKESSIPQMAADAIKVQRLLKNNPRQIEENDAIVIYKKAF